MVSCYCWDGECYDEVRWDGVGVGVFGVECLCNKEGEEDVELVVYVFWIIEGRYIVEFVEGVVVFIGNIYCVWKIIKIKIFLFVVIGEWI